jgi:hypothetical protein
LLAEKVTFLAQILFDAVPDVKQTLTASKRQPSLLLLPSDSQRELLIPSRLDTLADEEPPELLPSPGGLFGAIIHMNEIN